MTDDEPETAALEEALERAEDAILPPDDPNELTPEYPPDYTPEDRVEHVLQGEYPTWRSLEWVAAAADTEVDVCRSVIAEQLADGAVEISDEGVRRNRYKRYFDEVKTLTDRARDSPRRLR